MEMENKMDTSDATVTQSNRKANMNSQEEKMMRINAANARQKAVDGYCGSENRYEEMLPLAGLESVSKFRESKPEVKEVISKFIGPLPSTPPKPTSICIGDDFEKETATDLHPTIFTTYLIVGLKSAVYVEKKCIWRSNYWLKKWLDNCFLDRYLQAKYGSKWYCKTHFSLPFTEKVNKLERTRRKGISDGWVEGRQAIAVVNPMPSPSNDTPWKEDKILHLEDFNSPTSLVSKAMERVRSREVAADLLYPAVEKANDGDESSRDRLFGRSEAAEFVQLEQDSNEFNMKASVVKKRSISQPEAAQDEIAELQTKRSKV
uniref:Uncharacterized protein n=1 Tax=Ditylenchus dipsaci TaxID=166011 RepID=A0A915DTW7_9BILA